MVNKLKDKCTVAVKFWNLQMKDYLTKSGATIESVDSFENPLAKYANFTKKMFKIYNFPGQSSKLKNFSGAVEDEE